MQHRSGLRKNLLELSFFLQVQLRSIAGCDPVDHGKVLAPADVTSGAAQLDDDIPVGLET